MEKFAQLDIDVRRRSTVQQIEKGADSFLVHRSTDGQTQTAAADSCMPQVAHLTGLIAERVLDQFRADGAEENNLYCNPAPNGDKRHADLRPDLDHEPAGFTRSSIRFPCQRRGAQSSKPAEPMILCAPCDKIQSGDGCVANIGGFPAEPSAPDIEPLRRCRRIGEAR
jgi:hypothetical protein